MDALHQIHALLEPHLQLAQALERILGLKRAGKLEEALRETRATADGIFGLIRSTLDALDERSASSLRLLGGLGPLLFGALNHRPRMSVVGLWPCK